MARRTSETAGGHSGAANPQILLGRVSEGRWAHLFVWRAKETPTCAANDTGITTIQSRARRGANPCQGPAEGAYFLNNEHGDAS
jgi:hypothetical protein